MDRTPLTDDFLSAKLQTLNLLSSLADCAEDSLMEAEQSDQWVPTDYEVAYLPGIRLSGLLQQTNVSLQSSADLHIHTNASDGSSIDGILKVAIEKRLDAIAITDHDTIEMALEARRIVHRDRLPLAIIPGVEVSSSEGHIGALFVTCNIPKGMSALETITAIHKAGGIAVAHHPIVPSFFQYIAESPLAIGNKFLSLPFDAVEVTNAVPGYGARYNVATQNLVKENGCVMAFTGGSDAHHCSQVGKGLTFYGGNQGIMSLRRSLEEGVTLATESYWSTLEKFAYYFRLIQRIIFGQQETVKEGAL
jgi:hypothetical protein